MRSGGGLYNDAGRLTLIAVDVSGNEATYGGGIYNSLASLSLSQSAIHDNTAVVQGGGIDSGDASLDIFQTAIYGNTTTTHDGGGIHFGDGRLTISQSTLFDNSAARDGGGSYFSDGTFQLSASTVYDNSAGRDGGGLFTPAGGVDIFQSTLSGNTAVGAGGGLASESNSKLVNVTVTDNRAGSGGGLWVRQSGLLLNNTIVAGNAQLDGASHNDLQVAGTTPIDADSRHNLFGWGGSGNLAHDPGGTGNLVGFDPLLAELGHYGGPTPTHELLAGSPAIDAGEVFYALHPDGQSLVTDQRGSEFPRLVSQLLDIGAVEQRIAVSLESGEMLRIDDRSSHLNRIVLAATTTAEGNRVTINGAPIPPWRRMLSKVWKFSAATATT